MKIRAVEGFKFSLDIRPDWLIKLLDRWEVNHIKRLFERIDKEKAALMAADKDVNIDAVVKHLRALYLAAIELESLLKTEDIDAFKAEARSFKINHHFKDVYDRTIAGKQLSLTDEQLAMLTAILREYDTEFTTKIEPKVDAITDEKRRSTAAANREMLKDIMVEAVLIPFQQMRWKIKDLIKMHGALARDVRDLITQFGRLIKRKETEAQHTREIRRIKAEFERSFFPHFELMVSSAYYIQKFVERLRKRLHKDVSEVGDFVTRILDEGFPESVLKQGGKTSVLALKQKLETAFKDDPEIGYAAARVIKAAAHRDDRLEPPRRKAA